MASRGKGRQRQFEPDGPFEARIEDLSQDARGVARVDGKVVFISDALAEERVSYMRTRSKSSFDEGVLTEILEASPDRITPNCQHFGLCGGCSLQHLSSTAQLRFKQDQLLASLQRIGRVTPQEVADALQGPLWAYRRRARLGVKSVASKGRVLVGFRERGNANVADLQRCEILRQPVGDMLADLAELIQSLSIHDQIPQIEVAVADNAIALVLRVLIAPSSDDQTKLTNWSRERDVWFYLQTGGGNTIKPLLDNTPELLTRLDGDSIELQFQPTDFLQINSELNELMLQQAMQWLAPTKQDSVLELFCGLGNFSLPLARRSGQVTGVEGEASLVARAKANAERNQISNTDFHTADLFENHAKASWLKGKHYDLALIDPPRAGAEAAVGWLAKAKVKRIVYVSCHPATLARDAGLLVHEHGYTLKKAGVLDMFPHTQHVESMALFERNT